MNPFVDNLCTYDRKVRDPRDGEEWNVTMRPLHAGDRAELQDLTRMSMGDEENSAELRLGAMQLITLERAIINWTLPSPPTGVTIRQLHPEIYDQIYEYVSWGDIPAEVSNDPLDVGSNGSEGPKKRSAATASS